MVPTFGAKETNKSDIRVLFSHPLVKSKQLQESCKLYRPIAKTCLCKNEVRNTSLTQEPVFAYVLSLHLRLVFVTVKPKAEVKFFLNRAFILKICPTHYQYQIMSF